MSKLTDVIEAIVPVDAALVPSIQDHLDDLTKPRGSLGRLEELAMRYALIQGTSKPIMGRKRICCFAGDHGVAAEGVSAFPAEVTPQMVRNMLAGGAAINVLTGQTGAELVIVDMGVNDPLEHAEGLCRRKVRYGTDNFVNGPAMSVAEAESALMHGIDLAHSASADGVTMVGVGEMGIANTTAATALLAACLECPVAAITGRGTGIDDQTMLHKAKVIEKALSVNRSRLTDPLNILAAVGGLEIAGICGFMLGAAQRRMAVVVDGFIATAAAVVACKMNAAMQDYMIFGHVSQEQGHRYVLKQLNVRPVLELEMRLGEGTGAALAMSVVTAAVAVYNEMATFSSAGVSDRDE